MTISLVSYATRSNFGRCFEDSVDYFFHALTELRYRVVFDRTDKCDLYLVFGWHLSDEWKKLPQQRTVIIQLENLLSGALAPMFKSEIFAGWNVADYSAQNHSLYKIEARSFTSFTYGYSANMQYIDFKRDFAGKKYDALFVGSTTPRRLECFTRMKNLVRVGHYFNVFGTPLYRLMESSRIIVSPDAYERTPDGRGHIPASLRVAFALNQGMPVLMETSSSDKENMHWRQFAQVTTSRRFDIRAFEMLEEDYDNHCDAAERWCNRTSMRANVATLLSELKLHESGSGTLKGKRRLSK
jgi:hypothetical protein